MCELEEKAFQHAEFFNLSNSLCFLAGSSSRLTGTMQHVQWMTSASVFPLVTQQSAFFQRGNPLLQTLLMNFASKVYWRWASERSQPRYISCHDRGGGGTSALSLWQFFLILNYENGELWAEESKQLCKVIVAQAFQFIILYC